MVDLTFLRGRSFGGGGTVRSSAVSTSRCGRDHQSAAPLAVPRYRAMGRGVAPLVVVALMSGCSFLMVRPSPRQSTRVDKGSLATIKGHGAEADALECGSYATPAQDLLGIPLGLLVGAVVALEGGAFDGERCKDQPDSCREDVRRSAFVGIGGGIGVAALFLTSSIYGFAENRVCRDRLWERRESRALELVKAARTAAQHNDCATVIATGADVMRANPEIHATLFISDPAIQRCTPRPSRPAKRDTEAADESGGDARSRALKLTSLASDHATRGDCATVRSQSARVRSLDPLVHVTVFVVDAAIKRCLAPTPVPPIVEPQVAVPVPASPTAPLPIAPSSDERTDPSP